MGDERDPAGPRDGSKFSVKNQEVAAKDGKLIILEHTIVAAGRREKLLKKFFVLGCSS